MLSYGSYTVIPSGPYSFIVDSQRISVSSNLKVYIFFKQVALEAKVQSLEKENKKLLKLNETLQSKTSYMANQVQKACSSSYQLTRGYSKRKSPNEYSECHCHTLKRQRNVKCASSLE